MCPLYPECSPVGADCLLLADSSTTSNNTFLIIYSKTKLFKIKLFPGRREYRDNVLALYVSGPRVEPSTEHGPSSDLQWSLSRVRSMSQAPEGLACPETIIHIICIIKAILISSINYSTPPLFSSQNNDPYLSLYCVKEREPRAYPESWALKVMLAEWMNTLA